MKDAWEPALSFWYRTEGIDAGDVFNVVLTLVEEMAGFAQPVTTTQRFTPDLGVDDGATSGTLQEHPTGR